MIVESIIGLVLNLGSFIITLIPKLAELPFIGISNLLEILGYALWFFPIEFWIVAVGNIGFWIATSFSWSLIEWVYKKIPGVE